MKPRKSAYSQRMSSKDADIRARVSQEMKLAIAELARRRGEKESLVIREALRVYLEKVNVGETPVIHDSPPTERPPQPPIETVVYRPKCTKPVSHYDEEASRCAS